MWFKNLHLFRLAAPFEHSAEELEEQLARARFRPCGSLELATLGWVPPLGRRGSQLVHATAGHLMICACREEKVLPASVVREVVEEKVAEIEDQQMRAVRRKEREGIRDEVLQDLLPRAFTRSSLTCAWIAPQQGWLVVDAANRKRAEDLASLLRKSLGSLEAVAPKVARDPIATMTAWLVQGRCAPGFELEDECELRDPAGEGGIVRCRRQDLAADEIRGHLAAGKQAVKLALAWNERLSFVLGEDLGVRRLRFEDLVREQADSGAEDEAARFDADFAVMALELAAFLPALMEAFGGLATVSSEKSPAPSDRLEATSAM
jgi:recombination associated protein RdgC